MSGHPIHALRKTPRHLLEANAIAQPDKVLVSFEDGSSWTSMEALDNAYRAADYLRAMGLQRGGRLMVSLDNGPDFLRSWWGAACLGTAIVPIGPTYRGAVLERIVSLARPTIAAVDPARAEGWTAEALDVSSLPPLVDIAGLHGSRMPATSPDVEVEEWEFQSMMMTSGTTGPSKLAGVTYRQAYFGGTKCFEGLGLDGDDVYLADTPLWHMMSQYYAIGALAMGARIAIRSRPDLANYWEVARETGATFSAVVSGMVGYLLDQPQRSAERKHSIRSMVAVPLPADVAAFRERFGVEKLQVVFGSTETPAVTQGIAEPGRDAGYSGGLEEGYELRLVNDHDEEVAPGEPGEAIVRHVTPWIITTEYVANPEATSRAWRNGWFHTGDILREGSEGEFYFVGRSKDALRRRGEMIPAAEVELAVLEHPDIAECACVAFRELDSTDDEVKVWVVARGSALVDFESVLEHCVRRLPHYMVPRYFELSDDLPKTVTERVKKYELRERGNSAHTWDREAWGFRVTRAGFSRAEA